MKPPPKKDISDGERAMAKEDKRQPNLKEQGDHGNIIQNTTNRLKNR